MKSHSGRPSHLPVLLGGSGQLWSTYTCCCYSSVGARMGQRRSLNPKPLNATSRQTVRMLNTAMASELQLLGLGFRG